MSLPICYRVWASNINDDSDNNKPRADVDDNGILSLSLENYYSLNIPEILFS